MPGVGKGIGSVLAALGLVSLCAGCAPVGYYGDVYGSAGCRDFQQLVGTGAAAHAVYTTQCVQPDGSWKIVSQSNGTPAPATGTGSVALATGAQLLPEGAYPSGFAVGAAAYPYGYPYAYPYADAGLWPYPGFIGPDFGLGIGFGGGWRGGWHGRGGHWHGGGHGGGFGGGHGHGR